MTPRSQHTSWMLRWLSYQHLAKDFCCCCFAGISTLVNETGFWLLLWKENTRERKKSESQSERKMEKDSRKRRERWWWHKGVGGSDGSNNWLLLHTWYVPGCVLHTLWLILVRTLWGSHKYSPYGRSQASFHKVVRQSSKKKRWGLNLGHLVYLGQILFLCITLFWGQRREKCVLGCFR